MEDHLMAIERNILEGNYYSAIFMAIMLPSICGALESTNGEDTQQKYIDWYERYVLNLSLTGEDCYRLRCSLLHQASTIHPSSNFSRVIFTFPVPSGNTFHNNILNDALNLDTPRFCSELIQGVRMWLEEMEENENYVRNIVNTIRLHPNGLTPYISGHPVIS
jgi:hypothetical protein